MQVEEDSGLEDLLDLAAGLDADRLDELAVPADDDLPVIVLFDEDGGLDVDDRPLNRRPRRRPWLGPRIRAKAPSSVSSQPPPPPFRPFASPAASGLFGFFGFLLARAGFATLDGVDIDGRRPGQFLLDVGEDLLPDDLGQQKRLGLVGDVLVAVELLRLRQVLVDTFRGRPRWSRLSAEIGMISLNGRRSLYSVDERQDPVLADDVDLVDQQEERRVDLLEGLEDELVAVAELLRWRRSAGR